MGTVLNGLRLRQRLSGLTPLARHPTPDSGAADDFVMVTLPGVAVDAATRRAAAAFADAEGLDVVDLVPGDLPRDQALDLARVLDTTTFRSAPLAPGLGALHAVAVRRDLWERVEAAAARAAPVAEVADPAAFVALMGRLKQHATRSTDLAVAPGLHAVDASLEERLGKLKAVYQGVYPVAIVIPAARSVLALVAALRPGWGTAAAAAVVLQPYLVTAGTPLRPRRRSPGAASVSRLVDPLAVAVVAVRRGRRLISGEGAEDPIEARRPQYQADLAQGTQRFFEARRTTCPWCDGHELVEVVRVGDLAQFKPGEFVIEKCAHCGHVFQNPRLSLEGLDFYYRDAYDGLGEGETEFLFAQSEPAYRGRVGLVQRHGTPRAWLDVGTGYGHFCLVARGLLPETSFSGLDMGNSVETGQQRGWLDHGFRGLFPDMAEELKGRFDVVSMHHYLEHTRDPKAELDTARAVLEPGGRLLIEVPDPECRAAPWLGRYWVPYFQPQHQHLVPVANLCAALEDRGFSIIEVERGPAHMPMDLAGSTWTWIRSLAPPPRSPWGKEPSPADRLRRAVILSVLGPLAVLALLADRAFHPVIKTRAQQYSNAYRVLARREP